MQVGGVVLGVAIDTGFHPTGRQMEALRAYVQCGTLQAAAGALGISPRTVQSHLAALRERLGVHNEAQLVYVLWLGFRDHIVVCGEISHDGCIPYSHSNR